MSTGQGCRQSCLTEALAHREGRGREGWVWGGQHRWAAALCVKVRGKGWGTVTRAASVYSDIEWEEHSYFTRCREIIGGS